MNSNYKGMHAGFATVTTLFFMWGFLTALNDILGIHYAFILPALCYIYIAYYGFRGSRPAAAAAVRA